MIPNACCELPQTKRGHERRLALLLSATELFRNVVTMRYLWMILSIMQVVQKRLFINILVVKKVFLVPFVTTDVNFF